MPDFLGGGWTISLRIFERERGWRRGGYDAGVGTGVGEDPRGRNECIDARAGCRSQLTSVLEDCPAPNREGPVYVLDMVWKVGMVRQDLGARHGS